MQHYFLEQKQFIEHEIDFVFATKNYKMLSAKGIFASSKVDKGSLILAEVALTVVKKDDRVLDIGCGNGIVGILVGLNSECIVTFSDVNQTALTACNRNLKRFNLNFDTIVSDGFAKIEALYDVILFNPPIRAGKKVYYPILNEAANHLNPNGVLIVIVRKDLGAPSLFNYLKTFFKKVDIRLKKQGYHVIQASNDLKSKEE